MTHIRTVVRVVAVAIAVLGLALFLTRPGRPEASAGPCVVVAGPTLLPDVEETSGLAVSRRDPNVLWSHNDSGNAAVLFALDPKGVMRGRVRVPVRTRDWEDISVGRCPSGDCLYLADIGDNGQRRRQVQIYRVAEPQPGDHETALPDVFNATYADGPHNAEALFVIGSDLFIVTKDRIGSVYRATVSDSRDLQFQRLGQLGLEKVTDAEASRDEKSVVVRTLDDVVFYETDELLRGGNTPSLRIPVGGLKEPQGEGAALDGNMLYLSSEGGMGSRAGRFVSLRCSGGLS